MAKDSLFRTSLQGFNKQDVTDYIDNLNIRYNKQTDELEDEITALKKELEAMPELIRAKEDYDKLKEENELLQKEKNDLADALKAQGAELEEKEQLLEEAFSENAEYRKRIKQLEATSKDYLSSNTGRDNFTEEFEEILSQARKEAESVIVRAKELAGEIVDTAKEKARVQEETARAQAQEAIRQSDEAVRDNLKKVKYLNRKKDELSGIFKNHKTQMDSFFTSITQTLKGE